MLGNILGGDLFSDTAYSYLYLVGEVGVNIGFHIGYFSTAEEASSLMRNGKKLKVDINEQVLTGVDIDNQRYVIGPDWLSHSGSPLKRGLSAGLGDSTPYTKIHAQRIARKESGGSKKIQQYDSLLYKRFLPLYSPLSLLPVCNEVATLP